MNFWSVPNATMLLIGLLSVWQYIRSSRIVDVKRTWLLAVADRESWKRFDNLRKNNAICWMAFLWCKEMDAVVGVRVAKNQCLWHSTVKLITLSWNMLFLVLMVRELMAF